jgi:hypothetical protein
MENKTTYQKRDRGQEEGYLVGETRTGVTLRRHLLAEYACATMYRTFLYTNPIFRNSGSSVTAWSVAGIDCLLVSNCAAPSLISFGNAPDF